MKFNFVISGDIEAENELEAREKIAVMKTISKNYSCVIRWKEDNPYPVVEEEPTPLQDYLSFGK